MVEIGREKVSEVYIFIATQGQIEVGKSQQK